MKRLLLGLLCGLIVGLGSCASQDGAMKDREVRLIVLDPGHYHAALVQKTMYDRIDPTVHVYAPEGPEVREYLGRIEAFNGRAENPTAWNEEVYIGPDYLEKMQAERAGSVVVLAGNNRRKTEYITAAIEAGFNVFADKPMCIDADGFKELDRAFAAARKKNLLLYDIMTERYNELCRLQRHLVLNKDIFGRLQKGSLDEPAVNYESRHSIFKSVSGKPVLRPTWYFDTAQQGQGLVDVTTHLIDQGLWVCFPNRRIDYRTDVRVLSAEHWPTPITRAQYEQVTGAQDFPDYLKARLNDDGVLPYYCNGQTTYTVNGVHMKVTVRWDFQKAEAGYSHVSTVRGTGACITLRQGGGPDAESHVYVEPAPGADPNALEQVLRSFVGFQSFFVGLSIESEGHGWRLSIPAEFCIGHEAHFRYVTEEYLRYLDRGSMPQWEIDFMKAKYFITTRALELAMKQ